MTISEWAGKKAPQAFLENVPRLVSMYYVNHPDPRKSSGAGVRRRVTGYRRFSLRDHILARQGVSECARPTVSPDHVPGQIPTLPALHTAISIAANGVDIMVQTAQGRAIRHTASLATPTPYSCILTHNHGLRSGLADGGDLPSHNPPSDGGFKYNPEGGPQAARRRRIQERANEILANNLKGSGAFLLVGRWRPRRPMPDIGPYRRSARGRWRQYQGGVEIGVDPLGCDRGFWEPLPTPIRSTWGCEPRRRPTFSFAAVDRRKIRWTALYLWWRPDRVAGPVRHRVWRGQMATVTAS